MGYASYVDYLASELWHRIRKRIFARDKNTCRLCKAVAEQIHHLRYRRSVLEGRADQHLIAICRSCHERIEFRGDRKLAPSEVRRDVLRAIGKPVKGKSRRKKRKAPRAKRKPKPSHKQQHIPPKNQQPPREKPTPPPPQVHRPISTAPLAIQVPMPATGKPLARLRTRPR